jgi:hypothetical protein
MIGVNWFNINESSRVGYKNLGNKCVFISHQKRDSTYAKKIADYLISVGINVYFDEYDKDLRISRQTNNPKNVTSAIRKGINSSTHMLCIVSPNTLSSTWVPFEIGYGYDKTQLGVLTLKGIPKGKLPDYIKAAKFIIRDRWDINNWIANFLGSTKDRMEETGKVKSYSSYNHPLYDSMDQSITE